MIDIESRVAESLRAGPGGPGGTDGPGTEIKVDGLFTGAVARAGAIRRRRRIVGSLAGAGLAVVLAAGIVAVPRLLATGSGTSADAASPTQARTPDKPNRPPAPTSAPGPTTLPELTDVPAAGLQPSAVGTDAGVLHFDLDFAILGGHKLSDWVSGPGFEAAAVTQVADYYSPDAEVYLGPDAGLLDRVVASTEEDWPAPDFAHVRKGFTGADVPGEPTTVNGRPGTLQKLVQTRITQFPMGSRITWILRWQPVDGLHALVRLSGADDPALAYTMARALRLDHSQRCVLPLRISTAATAGMTVLRCWTVLRRRATANGVFVHGTVTFQQPDGDRVQVWAEEAKERAAFDLAKFTQDHLVNGQKADWRTDDPRGLWIVSYPPIGELFVSGGCTEAEAVALARGVTVEGNLAAPASWPTSLTG